MMKDELTDVLAKDLGYCSPSLKSKFHLLARAALKKVAAELHLERDEYDLRSNKAGIAVSGEVTLHGEKIYIQVGQTCMGRSHDVLYRTCKGRKDYSGGGNHFCAASELNDPAQFVSQRIAPLLARGEA